MSTEPTPYDVIAYPPMVFGYSHPDALALIAQLHGIPAPPAARARILHVGGGDGLDATAIAAATPTADVLNFDIAREAIARGQSWAERAGIANVRHELIDIIDAADVIEGHFDYIVAQGIYAWVPDVVRAQIMSMIARLLAPNGIAMVSYNTAPGGHSRMALRDMLLHHVRDIAAPGERLAAARALLRDFAVPKAGDQPITAAMRKDAQAALAQADGVFFHDTFGHCYAPQAFLTVASDAARHGLRYLGEPRGGLSEKGFVDGSMAGISDDELLNRLQAQDYRTGRYFRASLFVHADTPFSRTLDATPIRRMWASTAAKAEDETHFAVGATKAAITDPRRADMLRRLIAHQPHFLPVADLGLDSHLENALARYALEGLVRLRLTPPPYAATAGERPVASPLARLQAMDGETMVVALNHERGKIEDQGLLRLLTLLDGSRDRQTLKREWQAISGTIPLDQALQILADNALLSA